MRQREQWKLSQSLFLGLRFLTLKKMMRPDISEIYECDERNHSVQGPAEACISECMIHNQG